MFDFSNPARPEDDDNDAVMMHTLAMTMAAHALADFVLFHDDGANFRKFAKMMDPDGERTEEEVSRLRESLEAAHDNFAGMAGAMMGEMLISQVISMARSAGGSDGDGPDIDISGLLGGI